MNTNNTNMESLIQEIEQLKVSMALMMKSQEKLELKNKELEDQIEEATDLANWRWQRS